MVPMVSKESTYTIQHKRGRQVDTHIYIHTSSISHRWISSTSGCFATSLRTPPSPPPTTSTCSEAKSASRLLSLRWHQLQLKNYAQAIFYGGSKSWKRLDDTVPPLGMASLDVFMRPSVIYVYALETGTLATFSHQCYYNGKHMAAGVGITQFALHIDRCLFTAQKNHPSLDRLLTDLGSGWAQRGMCAIISWYANSSLSVHCMMPSSANTRPYVLLRAEWWGGT